MTTIENPPIRRFRLTVQVLIEAVSLHAAETVLAEIMDGAEDETQGYRYVAGAEETVPA